MRRAKAERLPLELPYSDYCRYITGPYFNKRHGRRVVSLHLQDGTKTITSYARYLMSVHLGRQLLPEEAVDHINGDKTDDRVENYQILSFAENMQKRAIQDPALRRIAQMKCPICSMYFLKEYNQTHLQKPGRKFTPCGELCKKELSSNISAKRYTEAQKKKLSKENFVSEHKLVLRDLDTTPSTEPKIPITKKSKSK